MSEITKIQKPWGHELIWANTDKYVGKMLHIDDGYTLSKQYHRVKDETIYVLSGLLTLELEQTQTTMDFLEELEEWTILLDVGESYHIKPGLIHRMVADNGPVDLIEVSTPELTDVIRLEDRYGRV